VRVFTCRRTIKAMIAKVVADETVETIRDLCSRSAATDSTEFWLSMESICKELQERRADAGDASRVVINEGNLKKNLNGPPTTPRPPPPKAQIAPRFAFRCTRCGAALPGPPA
jgi:hypothetical protein